MLSVSRALVALEGKADKRHLDPGNNGGGGGGGFITNSSPFVGSGGSRGGPRGPEPLFIFRANWGPKCRKNVFGDAPPPLI